ncbi:hypothetical protein RB595_006617 [Gaeumannomyces hyphopodioides]
MAVSPLIPPPIDPAVAAAAQQRSTSSPLKRQLSAVSSANGTPNSIPKQQQQQQQLKPRPAAAAATAAALPATDLIEQLNRAEADKYVTTGFLGEGTYATVHKGYERANPSNVVAIKMIKVQKEYTDGMPPDAVRELKHLQELSHPNIITLHAVYSSNSQNVCLVLEYIPLGDLETLIRDTEGVIYGGADIKAWMGMLTRAVWFCHENFVLHRDIKPNNLLIAADGEVKLADFGLARSFADPHRDMTANVITRWYRPPELLYGARNYSGAVDVWSVGCVFAELVLRKPYLPGNSELEQLAMVCSELGSPTEDNWPGVSTLAMYTPPADPPHPVPDKARMMATFGTAGADGVDLLMRTLTLDPRRRITARDMLRHPWWRSQPKPTPKEDLPRKKDKGAEKKAAADLSRKPGQLDDARTAKVARKLDFGAK